MNVMGGGKKPEDFGIINQKGLSRKVSHFHATKLADIPTLLQHIFDGVKKCLERLEVDYIDVLQCKCCVSSDEQARMTHRGSFAQAIASTTTPRLKRRYAIYFG